MRLAVIPARGGSKRIPDKNVRPFLGRPIIAYGLDAARESGLFETIHVSTDSEAIRALVETLGYPVDFMRDPALADDHTGLVPVMEWVVRAYRDRGVEFRDVCLLMPCAPLIEPTDLVAAAEAYERAGRRPLLAVAPFPAPPQQALRWRADGGVEPADPELFKRRSQDLEPMVFDTGTFLFAPAERLYDGPPLDIAGFIGFPLDRAKAVDINEESDFALAETLYLGRRARATVRT